MIKHMGENMIVPEQERDKPTQNLPGLTEAEIRRLRGFMNSAWERSKERYKLSFRQAAADMGLSSSGSLPHYLRGAAKLNLPFLLKYRDWINDDQFNADITPFLNKMISGDRVTGSNVKVIADVAGKKPIAKTIEFPGILSKNVYAVESVDCFYLISGDKAHLSKLGEGAPLVVIRKDDGVWFGKFLGGTFVPDQPNTDVELHAADKLYRVLATVPA